MKVSILRQSLHHFLHEVKLLNSTQDAGYSAQELRAAGFGAGKMMVRVGEGRRGLYDVQQLLAAGYSEDELRLAGFEVQQFKL
jgi:hypothetical protein